MNFFDIFPVWQLGLYAFIALAAPAHKYYLAFKNYLESTKPEIVSQFGDTERSKRQHLSNFLIKRDYRHVGDAELSRLGNRALGYRFLMAFTLIVVGYYYLFTSGYPDTQPHLPSHP